MHSPTTYSTLHPNFPNGMAVTDHFLAHNGSAESHVALTPLTPLRISSGSRSIPHPTKPKNDHTRSKRKQKIECETSNSGPGFDFDVSLPSYNPDITEADSDNDESSHLGRANRLAAVLLDSGKMINSKFNVVDQLGNSDGNKGGTQRLRISRAARNRTESVKALLTLKYHWLQRSMETLGDEVGHVGVEGVYNPLQVIRNRAVRAKNHEPPPLAFRSLPLACNAFSVHNRHGKLGQKPWKLLWGLELSEMVNDLLWRTAHWGELRNSRGELWFPKEAVKYEQKHQGTENGNGKGKGHEKEKHRKRSRLHDALFTDKESDELEDINVHMIPIESTRGSKVSLTKNLKRRLYGSSGGALTAGVALASDSDGPEVVLTDGNRTKSSDSLSKVRIGRIVRRGSLEDTDNEMAVEFDDLDEQDENDENEPPEENLQPPIIMVNGAVDGEDNGAESGPSNGNSGGISNGNSTGASNGISNNDSVGGEYEGPPQSAEDITDGEEPMPKTLQDVLFSPLHLRTNSEQVDLSMEQEPQLQDPKDPKETKETKETKEAGPPVDVALERLASLGQEAKHALKLLHVNNNYLSMVCPASMELIQSTCHEILQTEFGQLFRAMININENQLPAYENFYTGFANESKSLIHMANDNYAVQIDNLLSATDRLIGEINTSLSMDLRKVNEQLDKLNRSLFGSVVIEKLRSQDNSGFANGSSHKTLYFLLENTIVVVLRLVWIVVNVYKIFEFFVKFVWRILTVFC